jgi:hypothetical protein
VIERARQFECGDRAGLAVLDRDPEQRGRDIRRDIEIAVRPERDAVEADAILGRCERGIGCPDLERGPTRFQAVNIGREGVGDIGGAVAADDNVVAQRFRILQCEAAFRYAAREIEGLQRGALGVAGAGNAEAR